VIVLQGADHRVARVTARLLFHEVWRWTSWGMETASDAEDELRELQTVTERIAQIIAARSHRFADEVKAFFKGREVWMTAPEALARGLIDEVT
jgi:ATP-dependent protease ClpP protease subunit